jgi:glycosyltransferase involved in cell wall biosynthesis
LKEKIYVIGSAGVPARYGGFETFAENISLKLAKKYDITVFCSKYNYKPAERSKSWNSIQRIFLFFNSNGLQSIIYDLLSLIKSIHNADMIILLGSGIGLFLPAFPKRFRQKIWLHIDGLEWKRNKWNFIIKKYLHLSCIIGIRFSNKIIIDNDVLSEYISTKFHPKIVRSGYGGDHLPKLKTAISPIKDSFALVIARAEPENNLELILKCFSELNSLNLVAIANWHQTALGRKLKRKYAAQKFLSLIGPIFNEPVKLHTFRVHSSLYIHGHSAGGTNPSLVEAMHTGVPIFAFDNEFNRNTTNNFAFYFKSGEELMDLLKKRNSLDLEDSAQKLKHFATEFHTWDRAVKAFE